MRDLLEQLLGEKEKELKEKEAADRWERERIDVTLPGYPVPLGRKHPLTLVTEDIKEIFTGLGFQVARGPELESDYYNFEALNMPPEHPARDMQDSFYVAPQFLLRTHTSPVQIRTMELLHPRLPVRIIAPGKVYRRDDDATHSPMFHQVEGLAVDRGITLADLKGTLLLFAREMFGPEKGSGCAPAFSPLRSPAPRWTSPASTATGKAAGCAASPAGWRFWGPGWFTPGCCRFAATTPKTLPALPSGWGWSGLPCSATASMICASFSATTCAS